MPLPKPMYSDIIKELRHDKKITQEQMGATFGLSRSGYASLENGRRKMSFDMLCAIADILDTSTDYILGRTAEQKAPPRR